MARHISVNALLKLVIATLAAATMIVLAFGAWESWNRVESANRMAAAAEVSGHLFKALHNLRIDRASSYRDLTLDRPLTAMNRQIAEVRAAVMPALKATAEALQAIDLPDRNAVIAGLSQATARLDALHAESAAAFLKPKAQRRPDLAQEFYDECSALLETLERASSQVTRMVKLEDAFIAQLMELKQLAWVARNAGGDASLMISNSLIGQPLPADALAKYSAHVAKIETAWAALEDLASGLPLPPRFTEAMARAKQEFFAADYVDQRTKLLKALIAGERPNMTPEQWASITIVRLTAVLKVAEAALETAMDHAASQHATAMSQLGIELALLAAAAAFAACMMLVVTRRVTGPLQRIQDAMLRLAGGDLTAEVSLNGRHDEIGALGDAMRVFKDSMVEADRLRVTQKDAEARATAERRTEMERLAGEFEGALGKIVGAVSSASTELEMAAGTLTRTAENTQRLSGVVASASEEASANVQSVAAATEEMTSSVNEIARQVLESSKIASEAVQQANKTDGRIVQLSDAASRIGDVVKLITAIAEQTNLLALNATIEAARAGEAGRGFAVVAQEVKALAAQTAKATDEIGTQISAMQGATQSSVAAIRAIGGTIKRVSEIAATIASAVQAQGTATQEIARNVQQAARGSAGVADNIVSVSRAATETGTASTQVLDSARALASESGHLKHEVEKFLATVRAA